MTVFSFVHGGQQGAWCFEPLGAALEQRGHRSISIDLPVGDPDAGASRYADDVVRSLADAGDDVIVVGHSLGGLTIPLVAERRPVRLLVFLCAAVPEPGKSLATVIAEDSAGDAGADLLDGGGTQHLTPREQARDVFFFDLPVELQEWALDRQRAQCERPHREISPLERWPMVPVVIANGRLDRCIPIERARRSAQLAVGAGPIELDCGHFPFLSHVAPRRGGARSPRSGRQRRAAKPVSRRRPRGAHGCGNRERPCLSCGPLVVRA